MSETERIVILGAGGHAKVCIEIFRDMGIPLAYCIGDDILRIAQSLRNALDKI